MSMWVARVARPCVNRYDDALVLQHCCLSRFDTDARNLTVGGHKDVPICILY